MTFPMIWTQRRARIAADPGNDAMGEDLVLPLKEHGRLAVVDARFAEGLRMRAFNGSDIPGLEEFSPQSMVFPVATGLLLATLKLSGALKLAHLQYALIAISTLDPKGALLSGEYRDWLWRAFGLPVFEQLRGGDGRVAARECEIHDGLHFDDEALVSGVQRRFSVEIVREVCECGAETPRLRNLTALRSRAAAA